MYLHVRDTLRLPLGFGFFPYYLLLGAAGVYHLVYGALSALNRLGVTKSYHFLYRSKLFYGVVLLLTSGVFCGVFSFRPTQENLDTLADELPKFDNLAMKLA